MSTSTDNGGSWGTKTLIFGGTGRTNPIWFSNGTLALVYRDVAVKGMMVRYSQDSGSTWYPPYKLTRPLKGGMMTYAFMVETISNQAFIAYCEENSAGNSSTLYGAYLAIGGGVTPLGIIPGDTLAESDFYDNLLYSSSFRQPDGALASPWNVFAGGLTVTDGIANSTAADGTADRCAVHLGESDQDVYAEMYHTGGAGVGLVFRWVDASNYLWFVLEATAFRIYKISAGVATQIAIQSTAALSNTALDGQWGSYNRYRVLARGNSLYCWFNDQVAIRFPLVSGDQTQYGGSNGLGAGFGVNSSGGVTHGVRRFLAFGS
jgi:hypothetical protein